MLKMFQVADEHAKQLSLRLLSKVPLPSIFSKIEPELLKKYGLQAGVYKVPYPPPIAGGGGCLSSSLGKNIELGRGEVNIKAVRKKT